MECKRQIIKYILTLFFIKLFHVVEQSLLVAQKLVVFEVVMNICLAIEGFHYTTIIDDDLELAKKKAIIVKDLIKVIA